MVTALQTNQSEGMTFGRQDQTTITNSKVFIIIINVHVDHRASPGKKRAGRCLKSALSVL